MIHAHMSIGEDTKFVKRKQEEFWNNYMNPSYCERDNDAL